MASVVMIWSDAYRGWWLPDGQGYTANPDLAGRWWLSDALYRTQRCGPEKRIRLIHADAYRTETTPSATGQVDGGRPPGEAA